MNKPWPHLLLVGAVMLVAGCTTPPSKPSSPSSPSPPPSMPTPPSSPSASKEQGAPKPPGSPSTSQSKSASESQSQSKSQSQPQSQSASTPAGAPPAGSGQQPTPAGSKPAGSTSESTAQNQTGAGSSGAMTEEEKAAVWDKQFDVALGDFDQRMAREQIELEKQRAAGGGSGKDEQDGEGTGGGGSGRGGGQLPSELPPGEGGAANTENAGFGGVGQPSPGPRFPAPAGTPDGKDDDVVARQLREAAAAEKDPELRAKLWEEYRKYKSRKS